MRCLLIDDMRDWGQGLIPLPEEGDEFVKAQTYDEGHHELVTGSPWDVLYMDHDLGDPDEAKTGYKLLSWLEAECQDPIKKQFFLPKKIVLVTSNPVGRRQMEVIIERLYQE